MAVSQSMLFDSLAHWVRRRALPNFFSIFHFGFHTNVRVGLAALGLISESRTLPELLFFSFSPCINSYHRLNISVIPKLFILFLFHVSICRKDTILEPTCSWSSVTACSFTFLCTLSALLYLKRTIALSCAYFRTISYPPEYITIHPRY